MKINNINGQYTNTRAINNNNINNKNNSQTAPSFKGGDKPKELTTFGNFYKKVADSSIFQKGIKFFSQSDRTFTHLLVIESTILSGFYMINTLRNKKIEDEQKPQMIINDTLTLGLSTAGAYFAEDKVSDVINKKSEEYFKNNSDFYINLGKEQQKKTEKSPISELLEKTAETFGKKGEELRNGLNETTGMIKNHLKNITGKADKLKTFQTTEDKVQQLQNSVKDSILNSKTAKEAQTKVMNVAEGLYDSSAARAEADKVMSGIRKLKVLVVFGFIYRFVGPVAITPVANKLSSKFFPSAKEAANQAAEAKKTENK